MVGQLGIGPSSLPCKGSMIAILLQAQMNNKMQGFPPYLLGLGLTIRPKRTSSLRTSMNFTARGLAPFVPFDGSHQTIVAKS